jgi:MFS transporter, ACS family, tartrate transporter
MSNDRIVVKCAWRLIPLIMLIYFVNILDRVNVGFAALTMNRDLGFSPAVYGFGAGLFFVGYLLFQIPANLILQRVGARRWIFCILAAWGAISTATATVETPAGFYAARILLGLAEAGFYPGMMLYMTYWFPRAYRARFVASLMTAGPFAFVIGGPLSSLILELQGFAGLHGWQLLFLIEGLPAILLAFAVLKFLPDGPAHAPWLTEEEKYLVAARLDAEQTPTPKHHNVWAALRDARIIALAIAYIGLETGSWGVTLWVPQIVQSIGFSTFVTGLLVSLPSAAGIVVLNLWARHSDRKDERIWHAALPNFMLMSSLIVASVSVSPIAVFLALSLAVVSLLSAEAPFWAIPPVLLSGTAAATGFAFINCVGTGVGGLLGPWIIGLFREGADDYSAAMAALAVAPALAAAIVLALGRSLIAKREQVPQAPTLAPGAGG